jgi:hypothetical protein
MKKRTPTMRSQFKEGHASGSTMEGSNHSQRSSL